MIFPFFFIYPPPWIDPYFGGFGHFNLPLSGAGFTWPGFTYPFNFQTPQLFALQAGFVV